MDSLKGTISRYMFFNEDNGYSVIRLEDSTVVVGNLPKLNEGDNLELHGTWVTHPKYGRQFRIEKYSVAYPTSSAGIKKYLGSGLIPGIGDSTAEKIVKKFGERSLDIIDGNIERLLEIEGIGVKKLDLIKKGWKSQRGVKDVMLFLQSHGISTAYSLKIYKAYGEQTVPKIKENPYRMISDVWGIGFKIADSIAGKLGFTDHDPRRIRAGIIHALTEISKKGHTYIHETELINYCSQLLNFELAHSDPQMNSLEEDGYIVKEKDRVYLADMYYAERGIEEAIENFTSEPAELSAQVMKILKLMENRFSEEQLDAIQQSVEHNILIITGGPGTGKTTALKGILEIYRQLDQKVMLAAPTGRAAKRMSEVIGLEAKTIHRLLEFNPIELTFNFNRENKLDVDLLIIDEVSMIDTLLMYHLITAVVESATIVFVGDVDQLPSVGPGNVLNDLIKSDKLPVIQLTKIFRQAEQSEIVLNAHRINKGEIPDLYSKNVTDFIFNEEPNNTIIPDKILHLVNVELPSRLKFDPFEDIQIIAPMYKGDAGVNAVNHLFQTSVNTAKVIYRQGERQFKLNDKVMQLRNNYDKGVFNGDIGLINYFNSEKKQVHIMFDNRPVIYNQDELDEITLAYAITVHKSQGNEFPCVIMPVSTSHYIMLQRNLLYTAITRASKLLILIGSKRAVAMAVNNNRVENRYTSLFAM
jgi:exodeoxyribonuclease V alpha subunit